MIRIDYCEKRKCLKINQDKEFIARGQRECERESSWGDGNILWPHFGYPCVPALRQVHVAAGDFGLVYSLPEDCLDDSWGPWL